MLDAILPVGLIFLFGHQMLSIGMESGLVLFAAEKFGWFSVKLVIFLSEKLFVLSLKICPFYAYY